MTRWTPAAISVVSTCQDTPSISALLKQCALITESVATPALQSRPPWHLKQLDPAEPDSNIGTLGLVRPDGVTLVVDFTRGKARHRLNEAGHGASQLKKSLGITLQSTPITGTTGAVRPRVIDTTGGLGQDAWAVASLGATVCVYESSPIVHALLANGLERAMAKPEYRHIAERITLYNEDAIAGLDQHRHGNRAPQAERINNTYVIDAIYLDPMFPQTRKSSKANKGMQFLQQLIGPPVANSNEKLLRSCLSCLARRVVVKRPKSAPLLEGTEQWKGQLTQLQFTNTRYDIYHHPGISRDYASTDACTG